MRSIRRTAAVLLAVIAIALAGGASLVRAAASDNPNSPDYWLAQYPNAVACYKYENNGPSGIHNIHMNLVEDLDGRQAIVLNVFQPEWPGDRWEVLIVKGGSATGNTGLAGQNVYELPTSGVFYYPPTNGGGQSPAVSHAIVCKGTEPEPTPTPTPVPTPTPTVEPTPEPTPTPTVEPTPTPTPEVTPSPTPEPSASPTPSPEPSESPTPTPSPTPSVTPEPTPTPSSQPTPTPSSEPSDTPAPSQPTPTLPPTDTVAPETDVQDQPGDPRLLVVFAAALAVTAWMLRHDPKAGRRRR